MAYQVSAVDQVMGRLFEKPVKYRGPVPSSRNSGSTGGGRPSRMQRLNRTAMGRPSAVFKLIKSGGTSERPRLKAQLEYIFGKSSAVVSNDVRYNDQVDLKNADMNRITRQWEQDWWGRASGGHTSHILLSYPVGTSLENVTEITRAVCNEMFESGDAKYKYVAGVHLDRDHPHAHIILNRRGSDDRLFTLRYGSEYSYQSFRDAMVAHGERRGVLMEASTRFERGIVDRAPNTREVYEAKEQGREAKSRQRTGKDLEFALEQVEEAQVVYQALSVLAENQGLDLVANALGKLHSDFELGNPVPLQDQGNVDPELQSEAEKLDGLLETLNASVERGQKAIADADSLTRPIHEKNLAEFLTRISVLNPESQFGKDLNGPLQNVSPYNPDFVADTDVLEQEEVIDVIKNAFDEIDINPEEVRARIKAGATSAYLEKQWMIADCSQVIEDNGYNRHNPDSYKQARADLADRYITLREDLEELGAFKRTDLTIDHAVIDDDLEEVLLDVIDRAHAEGRAKVNKELERIKAEREAAEMEDISHAIKRDDDGMDME